MEKVYPGTGECCVVLHCFVKFWGRTPHDRTHAVVTMASTPTSGEVGGSAFPEQAMMAALGLPASFGQSLAPARSKRARRQDSRQDNPARKRRRHWLPIAAPNPQALWGGVDESGCCRWYASSHRSDSAPHDALAATLAAGAVFSWRPSCTCARRIPQSCGVVPTASWCGGMVVWCSCCSVHVLCGAALARDIHKVGCGCELASVVRAVLDVCPLRDGQVKEEFGSLERREFLRARAITNVYERIGSGEFLNRCGVVLLVRVLRWASLLRVVPQRQLRHEACQHGLPVPSGETIKRYEWETEFCGYLWWTGRLHRVSDVTAQHDRIWDQLV